MENPQNNILRWRRDAIAFVREQFGIEPDAWQRDFILNYQNSTRSGAKACKGPGKTAVLAWCCWHFLACYPHSNIAATSITGENLRDGLWKEMSKWQQKSPLLTKAFTWRAERIVNNEYPETWFMSARRWARDATGEQQANALAGLHADYMMFVIDECGGIPDAVMAAAEAALANAGSIVNPHAVAKLLICGNPTHLTGPLYRACTSEASLWRMIEITGDPDDPKRSPRISIKWAREQIMKYGRDNPYVLVNVFGKFPPNSINSLLGPDEVEAAFKRVIPLTAYNREAKILGVDVAMGGGDPTVIMPRQGLVYFRPKIIRMDNPRDIASVVGAAALKWKPDMIFVDNTGGWGSGVITYLQDWGHPVTGVMFSQQKGIDPAYHNKRTEMIFNFTQHVKNGACLPSIPAFKEACVAQTYTHHRDQLLMQPKAELKEGISDTTGFDILDAAALTHAYPVARRAFNLGYKQASGMDYNPIDHNFGVGHKTQNETLDYNPISN